MNDQMIDVRNGRKAPKESSVVRFASKNQMLLQRFLRDSAVYVLGSLITRGLGLVLLPFYTRVLSPHEYGLIDLLLVFAAFANVTVAVEVAQGLARLLPEADERPERSSLASTALWFTIAAYSIFVLLCWAFDQQLAILLLDSPMNQNLLRVALASIWLNGLFNLLQSQLRFQLRPLQHSISSFVTALATISMTVVLVLAFNFGALGVIYGQVIGYACGAAVSFYFAKEYLRASFDYSQLKEMLGFSLPFVPSSVGVILTLYVDRLVIKELLTVTDVGIYGVAYRLASVAGLLMLGFRSALTPLIYTHFRASSTPRELARIFRLFVAFALALFVALTLFANEIVMLFTSPEYYDAATLIPVLVPSILLSGMYIFAPGLSIRKKSGLIALINLVTAAVNVVLNLALVPLLGTYGAALGTLCSSLLTFSLYMFLSQKHYFVPHEVPRLAAATVIVLGLLLSGMVLQHLASSASLIIAGKVLFMISVLPLLAWILVPDTFGGQKRDRLLG